MRVRSFARKCPGGPFPDRTPRSNGRAPLELHAPASGGRVWLTVGAPGGSMGRRSPDGGLPGSFLGEESWWWWQSGANQSLGIFVLKVPKTAIFWSFCQLSGIQGSSKTSNSMDSSSEIVVERNTNSFPENTNLSRFRQGFAPTRSLDNPPVVRQFIRALCGNGILRTGSKRWLGRFPTLGLSGCNSPEHRLP